MSVKKLGGYILFRLAGKQRGLNARDENVSFDIFNLGAGKNYFNEYR